MFTLVLMNKGEHLNLLNLIDLVSSPCFRSSAEDQYLRLNFDLSPNETGDKHLFLYLFRKLALFLK